MRIPVQKYWQKGIQTDKDKEFNEHNPMLSRKEPQLKFSNVFTKNNIIQYKTLVSMVNVYIHNLVVWNKLKMLMSDCSKSTSYCYDKSVTRRIITVYNDRGLHSHFKPFTKHCLMIAQITKQYVVLLRLYNEVSVMSQTKLRTHRGGVTSICVRNMMTSSNVVILPRLQYVNHLLPTNLSVTVPTGTLLPRSTAINGDVTEPVWPLVVISSSTAWLAGWLA